MTQSSDQSEQTAEGVPSTETDLVITRNNLGQFTKGVSGNPKGRAKGTRNRITVMKAAMEEALTRDMADNFKALMEQAMSMALSGDKDMIKLLLGDVLKEARKDSTEETEDEGKNVLNVSITQYLGPDAQKKAEKVIEGVFDEVRDSQENT